MYRILCGNTVIFDDTDVTLTEFLEEPTLELEAGKAGSLSFIIYPQHPAYNSFAKLITIITVEQNGEEIFRGRVLSSEENMIKARKITCEGSLAFFNDSVIRPYDYSKFTYQRMTPAELLEFYIDEHNDQVPLNKQFALGTVTVTLPANNYLAPKNDSYDSTLANLNKFLLNECGGYLLTRRVNGVTYIDYLSEFTTISNQTIEFGENLLDLTQTIEGDDVATAIIPLGEDEEVEVTYIDPSTGIVTTKTEKRPITIVGVIDPETQQEVTVDYIVNQSLVAQYGLIFKSVKFDGAELRIDLYNQAKSYVSNLSMLAKSIELNAINLSRLNVNVNSFKIGTKVHIISAYHGINDTIDVTKLSFNILHPEESQITLGKTQTSFTEGNKQESYRTDKLIENYTNTIEKEIEDIDVSIPMLKGSWNWVTQVAKLEQTDETKLVELNVTAGKIYVDCNNYQSYPNTKTVTNTPADGMGYFALYPVTDEDGNTIYHPFFAMHVVNNNGVYWYDINDSAMATVKTDIIIVGWFNLTTGRTHIWSGGRTTQEAEIECFMTYLANISDVSDAGLQTYASATGIDARFNKIAILEAFVHKLFANNVRIGTGTRASGYYVRIAEYDEETGERLSSPQFDIFYNGINFLSFNFSSGQVIIGDYEHGNGMMYDNTSNSFTFKGTGDFRGRLNTPTIQTLIGGTTTYSLGSFSTASDLINALVNSTDAPVSVDVDATGTINGYAIKKISYAPVQNYVYQYGWDQYADRIYYGTVCQSHLISNVTITFTLTNGSTVLMRVRKVQTTKKMNFDKNKTDYPSVPASPTLSNISTFTTSDSYSSYGDPRIDGTVANLVVKSSLTERLIINNLPSGDTGETNRVYKDSNGFLKIS